MKQSAVEWLSNELYEKFEMRGDGLLYDEILDQAKEIENQQQDELAIGFAEWLVDYYDEDESCRDWDKSTEELLEIYKKEKGL